MSQYHSDISTTITEIQTVEQSFESEPIEISFNPNTDNSLELNFSDNEPLSTQITVNSSEKCLNEKHCDTCSCFQIPVELTLSASLKKSMANIQYQSSRKLPQIAIRDVELYGDEMLETDQSGAKLLRNVLFKQYDSDVISKRVIDQTFEFQSKLLKDIAIPEEHTYMNFNGRITNYEAVMKYTIENNIQYSAETFNPTMIAYDIESFHPTDKTVIPTHLNGGIMSMICACFTANGKDSYKVYILDQYTYSQSQIEKTLIENRQSANHQSASQFALNVYPCENQTIMACQFLDDVQSAGISIMYGFNSSSTIKEDQRNDFGQIIERSSVGYDLPFIIHHSGRYTKEAIENGCKIFGKIGRQIKQISWLPNTYIMDCSIIFQNSRFFAMNLSEMPNRKLDSFLNFAQIPMKLDDMAIHDRMNQMKIKGENLTSTINYCLWDSYALTLVMDKIQFLDTTKANVEIFNIPLSWALHKNATNWITMYMLRTFYNKGQSFSYSKFAMPIIKTQFMGATTESCPIELQMQVVKNLLMGDYESLYPNSIIAGNLGIDSIIEKDNGNCYKVNLNFVDSYLIGKILDKVLIGEKLTKQEETLMNTDDNPNWVYFSKKPSIYASIVQEVLLKRLATKWQMKQAKGLQYDQLDARQNALKILVNTIYGLSGAKTFQLYDERVAASCTSIARQLTQIARECIEEQSLGQVVFRDTDSCGIMNVEPNAQMIKSQFVILNAKINQKLQASLGNTHQINFVAETDSYQVATYYPIAKKAYARLEMNLEKPDKGTKLKIKGVSWSLMSNYGKSIFQAITEHILRNLQTHDEIQSYVQSKVADINADILTLISTNNISEIARKYYKQIKNSANNKTAVYLRKKFDIQENEIQMLPIVKACKLKSQCVIPVKYALTQPCIIDANQILDWFISPIVKFFGKQEYEEVNYDDFESTMGLRIATQYGYKAKTLQMPFDQIEDLLDNKEISYNELIQQENRLFFDIDDSRNQTNFNKCLELIEQQICNFRLQSINIEYSYTKSNSKQKPHSYHVVYNIRSSLQMNLYIAKIVNQKMGFAVIDDALYSNGKSLRLPLTPKYCEKSKKLIQVHHNMVQGNVSDMFISNIDSVQNCLSNAIGFITNSHKEMGFEQIELGQKYVDAIKEYLPFEYTIMPQKDNCITICPIEKPYNCPVCKGHKHDSLNLKLYIRPTGFTIDCWSTTHKDIKVPIRHKFEAYNKQTGYEKRCEYLLNAISKNVPYAFKKINPANISFQCNKQVNYNLNKQATFVRSQMMTGKTKRQIELINNDHRYVLALSFRRTFARDNAVKNKFTNYEDCQGNLSLIDYPHLILQVDSLAKLDMSIKPDLLIVDEIESIIEQLTAIKRDTTPYILYKFIELLQTSKQVLFLDAELEQSTIQVMTTIMQTDNYQVFVNTYQPKTDYKIILHDYVCTSGNQKNKIIEQVVQMVNSGKRVIVSSTSSKLSEAIKNSISGDKIVKYYDGEDSKIYGDKSMAKIKHDDFKNVEQSWRNCDVLIYTGTLTAGISFELQHFDILIGVFSKMTSSPLAFTQGLHRVRNLNDKIMHLYLEKEYASLPQTSYDITETQTQIHGHCDLSEVSQFSNWIAACNNQNKNDSTNIIIRNLKNMGYNLSVHNQAIESGDKTCKATQDIKIKNYAAIAQCQITLEDIKEIPKLMKDTHKLIKNTDIELSSKYQKVKLMRSFFPDQSQANIDIINNYHPGNIEVLIKARQRIAEGNKIKNLIKKCLDERPELIDITIEQTSQIIDAMRLESKGNLKSQMANTVSKTNLSALSTEIYKTTQAVQIANKIMQNNISTESLNEAIKQISENKTLKALGFTLSKNGNHTKLNELLKHADMQIELATQKRVQINGKRTYQNTYNIKSISAQAILQSLAE